MAISEDTAALVAAQLTQAWATMYTGTGSATSRDVQPSEILGKVAEVYQQFEKAIREVPIRNAG